MFGSFIQRRKKIGVFKNVQFLTSPSEPVCSGFCGGTRGEEPTCQCRKRKRCIPWVGKIPWKRPWRPTLVFLTGKFHGQRSLAGYSPWDHKESDTAERVTQPRNCVIQGLLVCLSTPSLGSMFPSSLFQWRTFCNSLCEGHPFKHLSTFLITVLNASDGSEPRTAPSG